mgnify:CR=1 FL=1
MFNFIKWLFFHLLPPSAAHYINGGPSLPPPLTPEQEKALLTRMMAGDAAARDDLITHNLRLVVYLAKKYENSGVPQEDMISIGTIGLIKAVNTFTPARNIKLATYASRCIGNEILMYLRKSSNRRQEASIDEPLNTDGDGNELGGCDIDGEVLDMSTAGRYVAVLFSDRLTIYDKYLTEVATLPDVSEARAVLMRDDGSAVLAGASGASLYLP